MARLIVTLLILCLSSAGLCCNKGWYHFQGKCYTISQHEYDVTLAKRYCQISLGQLAHVNSVEMLRFFGSLPNFDGMNEYWVAEDSSLENSTESHTHEEETTLCSYVKILELKTEFCTEKKFFICETAPPEVSNICQPDFDYYGDHCYRTITRPPANFEDASRFCVLQNSYLAILDTEEKVWEAKAALLGKNETFFLSAQKKENVLTWTNGSLFDSTFDDFANYSDGDCVALASPSEHPLLFSWIHADCEAKYGYICESDPLPPKEVEITTTKPSTTTQSSLECPHGYNWKAHEDSGYCFWETTYETDRLNWFQARNFCKLYGGDLASYANEEQEITGLGGARGHYRGLWIGLKRDENNVFHWIDGNVLSYTNWAIHQPNLSSTTKFCVAHVSGTSEWGLDYCGVRRWFICKAPKVRNPVMPDMPTEKKTKCDIKGPSIYSSHWYKYENQCYLIQDANKYTWDTARYFCQDNGAHLISIHSFEETNFLLSMISGYPESNFWIGLSTDGPDSPFEWSDNSPLDIVYWKDTRSEIKDFNTCVTFNKGDGSWDVEHCNRLQGVICKRGENSSFDFTTTEPAITMPGNCEDGWYNLENKCYKLFGSLWSQRLNWALARKECEGMGASLASIHNKNEQELLTDLILEGFTNAWIGLQGIESGTIFQWSDDTRIDYTNWNVNEPNGYNEGSYLGTIPDICVEMEYGENSMGKWNALSGSEKKAYICQKMKDPTKTTYVDPFACPNITGWSKLGFSCFGFFEHLNMTWMDAQRECRKHSANLISYKNAAVTIFVKRKLKLKNSFFWTGVREKMEGTYEYVTGQALFYSNWMANQPRAASTFLDNCVAASDKGEWLVKSCKEKHPFICQADLENEPELKVDRSHSCFNVSGDWKDFGGKNCYLIRTDMKMSWIGSMHYCHTHGAYLASFHSIEEVESVIKNARHSFGRPTLHIGLMKKRDGAFQWVDKSPVDFLNWEEDVPKQEEVYEECMKLYANRARCKQCVEMDTSNGKWSYTTCDDHELGFICSSPKAGLSNPNENHSTQQEFKDNSEEKDTENKLIVGGIFGFLLCVLVILAIIGLIVYHLKNKKEVKPTLLEQDNL